MISRAAVAWGVEPQRHVERWRPAFRGYQRMRIVAEPEGSYSIEAEIDGPIAVGFTGWPETNVFLNQIQEQQRAVFL